MIFEWIDMSWIIHSFTLFRLRNRETVITAAFKYPVSKIEDIEISFLYLFIIT